MMIANRDQGQPGEFSRNSLCNKNCVTALERNCEDGLAVKMLFQNSIYHRPLKLGKLREYFALEKSECIIGLVSPRSFDLCIPNRPSEKFGRRVPKIRGP